MGRVSGTSKTTLEGGKGDSKVTKSKRFGFTITRDIVLLKAALQHNPFQLGNQNWADVAEEMHEAFKETVTERTVRDRVFHLKKLYEAQQIKDKTGTEEQKSERGKLIEGVIELYEESLAPINVELGADDATDSTTPETTVSAQSQQRAERIVADKERENIASDFVSESVQQKKKKPRLMPEDALIKMQMEHEMKLAKDRLQLEEEKMRREHDLEEKRLDLEMKREHRLNEENIRNNEIARMQIAFQENLIMLLGKFTEK